MKYTILIGIITIFIVSSYWYFNKNTIINEIDIGDCKINYSSEYDLEVNSDGLILNPNIFGLQILFIRYFVDYDMSRREFVSEKVEEKKYILYKNFTNNFEIYEGYINTNSTFLNNRKNYLIIGKTFYIHYMIYDKHIQSLVESCHETWKQESKESNKISKYLIENIEKELNLTHEEAILHLKKIGFD